jgi:hypothetical protein
MVAGEEEIRIQNRRSLLEFRRIARIPRTKARPNFTEDVQRVEINIESNERSLRIYEFSVGREGSGMFNVLVTFSPAGKIAVTCQHAVFPDIPLP